MEPDIALLLSTRCRASLTLSSPAIAVLIFCSAVTATKSRPVAADVVELLVVVQLPGKAKDRAYRLRSLNDPAQHRPFDRHVVREAV